MAQCTFCSSTMPMGFIMLEGDVDEQNSVFTLFGPKREFCCYDCFDKFTDMKSELALKKGTQFRLPN